MKFGPPHAIYAFNAYVQIDKTGNDELRMRRIGKF